MDLIPFPSQQNWHVRWMLSTAHISPIKLISQSIDVFGFKVYKKRTEEKNQNDDFCICSFLSSRIGIGNDTFKFQRLEWIFYKSISMCHQNICICESKLKKISTFYWLCVNWCIVEIRNIQLPRSINHLFICSFDSSKMENHPSKIVEKKLNLSILNAFCDRNYWFIATQTYRLQPIFSFRHLFLFGVWKCSARSLTQLR